MICLNHITVAYEREHPVLNDLTFNIQAGESVGLIGANGAGKTTLFKTMLGLLPFEGEIKIDGMALESRNLKEIRRKMGLVMQNSDNQMFMPTVLEDIIFAPMNYGLSREEAEVRADEILQSLDLGDIKFRHNHKLSGGEKRMASIAAVLATEPEVILMDEPTSALDPYNRRIVIRTINSLSKTKLIATHDLDMILETCKRVIFLADGKVVADGEAIKILADRELLEANRMELPLRYQGIGGKGEEYGKKPFV